VSGHENVVALHDALDGVFLENTQTVWVFFKVLGISGFIVGGVSVKGADFYHDVLFALDNYACIDAQCV
jgi:hypothetical protein